MELTEMEKRMLYQTEGTERYVSSRIQAIKKGARVGQLIITPVVIADFVSGLGEERGTGGFGSTGE